MKKLLLYFLMFSSLFAFSQEPVDIYQRIKIYTGFEGLKTIASHGFDVDHGEVRPHIWFIGEFSEIDVDKIRNLGFDIEVLIPDLKQHFLDNREDNYKDVKSLNNICPGVSIPEFAVPSNFNLGSMGGFFTYSEMIAHLDNMANLFPNLITFKDSISPILSVEGNPVFYVKISDNPAIDEQEPKVLYTALHHAREPVSMSQMIFYMYYLLENYSVDPWVQYIVDHTQMFFIPCLNPDGYLYNELTDPLGGGFWRKNRKNNGDGTFGIDLNRNYGFNWGFDSIGSSGNTGSQVYRGIAPFSEPETQAIRDFCITHNFVSTLNYHAFGNLLIYPWGYLPDHLSPDSLVFFNLSEQLTKYNNYLAGTGNQTVGYSVNGGSDDWMYGEQLLKDKSFAMTPECGNGNDGFWPAQSRIIPICQENVWPNLNLALHTLPYAALKDISPEDFLVHNDYINYSLTQVGIDTTGTYTVSLQSLSPYVINTGSPKVYSGLSTNQIVIDSIPFVLDVAIPQGSEFSFLLQIDFGSFVFSDTIKKFFGSGITVFAHNGDDLNGFSTLSWEETNQTFYSAPASITDSPFGDYLANEYNEIELVNYVSLSSAIRANLTFQAKWSIEHGYDYVQVFAATLTNPGNWIPLCGKYTEQGSSFQALNEPVYHGYQLNWVEEKIDLSDFLGEQVRFKFLLVSDAFVEYDGFYFDDLKVNVFGQITDLEETTNLSATIYQNYPNPSSGFTTIPFHYNGRINSTTSIKLINTIGVEVAEYKINQSSGKITVNSSQLAPGVYYYFISDNGIKSEVKKMIILN